MMQDPFQYIGRITKRDSEGRVRAMEIIHPDDTVTLSENPDENNFVTFVTVIDLGRAPE